MHDAEENIKNKNGENGLLHDSWHVGWHGAHYDGGGRGCCELTAAVSSDAHKLCRGEWRVPNDAAAD